MVFEFFRKLGGGRKRPGDAGERNAVVRRVVAAAADDARKSEEAAAAASAGAVGPAATAAAAGEPVRKPPPVAPPPAHPDEEIPREKIAQRAFEIWVRKGRPEGTAGEDWTQAEAELRAEALYRPEPEHPPADPR